MEKSKDLSILIYSCWKNSDMWRVFDKLFHKYWADCAYRVILLTDNFYGENRYHFDEIVRLDSTWYSMVMNGIKVANTPYIMLWMDDYLLCDYVKNEDIERFVSTAKKYHAANVRLAESPIVVPKDYKKDKEYGYYPPGTAYSFTTQIGIWDVDFLIKYVKRDWSAWDFEKKGSIEIKDYRQPMLAPKDYVFPYEEGVRRGKWMDCGIRVCRRNNIPIDFKRRKPMSYFELSWIYFKGGILSINPTLIAKIQNMLMYIKRKRK